MRYISWRHRLTLFLVVALLAGCASPETTIKRLAPAPQTSQAPAVCVLSGILPHSPAETAGLQAGDRFLSVNGKKPSDAAAVSDLIQQSGPAADIEVSASSGPARRVKVQLNKEKPRLGALCDLTGLHRPGFTPAGNESVTIFEGPYVLTLSGVLNGKLVFIRVHLSNYSNLPLAVSPSLFEAADADRLPLQALSPRDVMLFLHGQDGLAYLKGPAEPTAAAAALQSPPRKKRKDWTRGEEDDVKADAEYLNDESLRPITVESGNAADGLIYFLGPKILPFTVRARVEGRSFTSGFGEPQRAARKMSAEDAIRLFESQPRGTPVRLTLQGGKVFVGKFTSYDSLNEIVWFDAPSGGLLNATSFGLGRILWAEPLSLAPNVKKSNLAAPAD